MFSFCCTYTSNRSCIFLSLQYSAPAVFGSWLVARVRNKSTNSVLFDWPKHIGSALFISTSPKRLVLESLIVWGPFHWHNNTNDLANSEDDSSPIT